MNTYLARGKRKVTSEMNFSLLMHQCWPNLTSRLESPLRLCCLVVKKHDWGQWSVKSFNVSSSAPPKFLYCYIIYILQGAQASSYSILYPYLAWTPCSHVHINAFDWQCKRRRRVSRRKEAKPEKKCLGLFLARYNLPSFKASASEPMTLNCQAMPFRE